MTITSQLVRARPETRPPYPFFLPERRGIPAGPGAQRVAPGLLRLGGTAVARPASSSPSRDGPVGPVTAQRVGLVADG